MKLFSDKTSTVSTGKRCNGKSVWSTIWWMEFGRQKPTSNRRKRKQRKILEKLQWKFLPSIFYTSSYCIWVTYSQSVSLVCFFFYFSFLSLLSSFFGFRFNHLCDRRVCSIEFYLHFISRKTANYCSQALNRLMMAPSKKKNESEVEEKKKHAEATSLRDHKHASLKTRWFLQMKYWDHVYLIQTISPKRMEAKMV